MRLHLIRKADNALVGRPIAEGGSVPHPDKPLGRLVSPAREGWEDDTYRVVAITEAPQPKDGKRRVGSVRRAYDTKAGTVVESFVEEDRPAAVERTDAEKLTGATGLSIEQIKTVLGIASEVVR